MKILFLNNFYYLRGGSEKVMFEEMRLLRDAGHEVAAFARGHERNEPAEYSEFFPPSLETERLGFSPKTVQTVKELIYSHDARRGLKQVVSRFKPDIVHAHNIYGRLSLSVLDELKTADIPVVMTLHDLKLLCPSYLMLNHGKVCERCRGKRFFHAVMSKCHKGSYLASFVYAVESWINRTFGKYASVSRFITPSRFLRDKCIEYGWDARKIQHIPNFIDSSVMSPIRRGGGYLLYIGRLSHEKGVVTLIRAYAKARQMIPLMIVGDGPMREALELEAHTAGLPIKFAGFLRGAQLAEALNGALGVVMPSEWYENAPLSLLESFAAGKPVIGARIGGIPEMIDNGVNGFLFEPGNVSELASMLERFISLAPERINRMGRSARTKVEEEFTEKLHTGMLLDVYHSVLKP